jgi:hypothetical protein
MIVKAILLGVLTITLAAYYQAVNEREYWKGQYEACHATADKVTGTCYAQGGC